MMSFRARVVVPCYNEARRLDRVALAEFSSAHPDVAFTLVDDGSTDATWPLLAQLAAEHPHIDALRLERNGGKAEAVRRGVLDALARADAPLIGYWDADFATPLDALPEFIAELEADPELRLLMGARVALLGRTIRRRAVRHYTGRVIATLAAATLQLPVYDTQCGAKLLRAGADAGVWFGTPFGSRWMFDVELIARMLHTLGRIDVARHIRELPIRSWTEVPGSKIRLRDGFHAMGELVRIRRRYFATPGI